MIPHVAQLEFITPIFNSLANTKESGLAILLFLIIAGLGFYGIYRMSVNSLTTSSSGFQTLATDLAADNRVNSQKALSLAEQFGELKGRFVMLEIEFKGVVSKLADSEKTKLEVLEKVDLLTQELAKMRGKLDEANKQLELKTIENVQLVQQVSTLQREVDTLQKQVVLLQSTSPTVLGDTDL